MNNSIKKQAVNVCEDPAEGSVMENLVERLFLRTEQLAKSVEYCKETIRRLDNVANKLNPDRFYKNQPVEEKMGSNTTGKTNCYPTTSGITLSLSRIIENIENSSEELDYFTTNEAANTVRFFQDQI